MDIFKERYFNLNRKLLISLGLWPHESKEKNIRKYLILCMQFVLSLPQIISAIKNFSDIDRAMLNITICMCAIILFWKMLCMVLAADKMKGLYKDIADNWLGITDDKEKDILIEYGEVGRKKSYYYFVILQIGIGTVYVLPSIPKILDLISPQGNPRPNIHILEGEMFLDKDKYYIVFYLWDAVTVIINAYVCVTVDTMYIVCVEHCSSLYAIISYRLNNLNSKMSDDSKNSAIGSYDYVISIIQLHQKVLDFTATINDAFSTFFFFTLIANMIAIPLVSVTIIVNLNQPFNCIRFAMLFNALALHLFMLFWPGQNVLNDSTKLTNDAYCNEWYTSPLSTRKLLVTFMIRCTQPALLTAGGLMLMNFETYSAIMRTALSYITVAASFR